MLKLSFLTHVRVSDLNCWFWGSKLLLNLGAYKINHPSNYNLLLIPSVLALNAFQRWKFLLRKREAPVVRIAWGLFLSNTVYFSNIFMYKLSINKNNACLPFFIFSQISLGSCQSYPYINLPPPLPLFWWCPRHHNQSLCNKNSHSLSAYQLGS